LQGKFATTAPDTALKGNGSKPKHRLQLYINQGSYSWKANFMYFEQNDNRSRRQDEFVIQPDKSRSADRMIKK
jgi:hypothetical protein